MTFTPGTDTIAFGIVAMLCAAIMASAWCKGVDDDTKDPDE